MTSEVPSIRNAVYNGTKRHAKILNSRNTFQVTLIQHRHFALSYRTDNYMWTLSSGNILQREYDAWGERRCPHDVDRYIVCHLPHRLWGVSTYILFDTMLAHKTKSSTKLTKSLLKFVWREPIGNKMFLLLVHFKEHFDPTRLPMPCI